MARENGHLERPASPQELEEALDRLYKGQTNVAFQAESLGITLERLKQLFREYVIARPIDVNDEDVWLGDVTLCWPYA
jgi:hypothetical protein